MPPKIKHRARVKLTDAVGGVLQDNAAANLNPAKAEGDKVK